MTPRIERRVLHTGRKFSFEMVSATTPGGRRIEREVVRHPGAVVIVPLLMGAEGGVPRIVMIRNWRLAPEEELLECAAGTLEPPELPSECAARELVEETGYEAATLTPLGWFYTTPGMTDERMHAFCGLGLREVGQRLEEDEEITVVSVPVDEALAMIDDGRIRDGKTIAAVLMAARRGLLSAGGKATNGAG